MVPNKVSIVAAGDSDSPQERFAPWNLLRLARQGFTGLQLRGLQADAAIVAGVMNFQPAGPPPAKPTPKPQFPTMHAYQRLTRKRIFLRKARAARLDWISAATNSIMPPAPCALLRLPCGAQNNPLRPRRLPDERVCGLLASCLFSLAAPLLCSECKHRGDLDICIATKTKGTWSQTRLTSQSGKPFDHRFTLLTVKTRPYRGLCPVYRHLGKCLDKKVVFYQAQSNAAEIEVMRSASFACGRLFHRPDLRLP